MTTKRELYIQTRSLPYPVLPLQINAGIGSQTDQLPPKTDFLLSK